MKKGKFLTALMVLSVVILSFVSCGEKGDYTTVIPADAQVVISMDIKSLLKKSGIADNKELKGKIDEVLKEGLNAEQARYMERVLKNPSESGISIDDRLYFFLAKSGNIGFVGRVSSLDKLKASFKQLSGEGIAIEYATALTPGWEMVVFDDKDYCCFNDATALFVFGESITGRADARDAIEGFIAQTAAESITANEGYRKLSAKSGDLLTYTSMGMLPDMYANAAKESLPAGVNLSDMKVLLATSFEKGKIVMNLENYTANEELQKINEQSAKLVKRFDAKYLDYVPASALYYVGTNFEGKGLVEVLESLDEYQNSIRPLLAEGVDLNAIMSSISGNLVFTLNSLTMLGMPSMAMYVEVTEDVLLNTICNLAGPAVERIDDGAYAMDLGQGMKFYFGMKDNLFYVSSDNAIYEGGLKKVSEPLSGHRSASSARNSLVYFFMNIKEINNLQFWALLAGNQEAGIVRAFLAPLDYIDMKALNTREVEIDIALINDKENALKQLVSLTEELVGKY